MNIFLHLPHEGLFNSVQEIFRIFDLEVTINNSLPIDGEFWLICHEDFLSGRLRLKQKQEWAMGFPLNAVDYSHPEFRRQVRLLSYRLLVKALGRTSPWGILTGVRPTKIVHRLLDQGLEQDKVLEILQTDYALAENKAKLLQEVALIQRPFLPKSPFQEKQVGIYIGIPFCPSRCSYCSFPAYALPSHQTLVQDYLDLLVEEIRHVGQALKENRIRASSIYVGGGTPTSLDLNQLEVLLKVIDRNLRFKETKEFTVEAGRPDTLNYEKIRLLKDYRVDRVSINPQTMQEHTLKAIGRNHMVKDIYRAMELVRKVGFKSINMDMILGLPGETVEDVADTLNKIFQLAPDEITVHTLAIKRASSLKQENPQNLPSVQVVTQMSQLSQQRIKEMGYRPYYLYRQKRVLANLENVGYAKPGKECLYNIQIMEERQSIIGLGVGAGSKYVNPRDFSLTAEYNPKDILDYLRRGAELIRRKIDKVSEIM